jgi:hypothetical protein
MLETLLHQLRLAYVTLQNEYGSQMPTVDPSQSSIIQP